MDDNWKALYEAAVTIYVNIEQGATNEAVQHGCESASWKAFLTPDELAFVLALDRLADKKA